MEKMIEIGFPVNHVFSVDERYSNNISGYYPIYEIADRNNIPFTKIHKINDNKNVEIMKKIQPDYIFVIGISQLVSQKIINVAKVGAIGFHPAPLPKMRGRAANAWQVLLGIQKTACSMFFLDEGIDSGDILGQEPYTISDDDYAQDVAKKIDGACEKLAGRVLQQILDGTLIPVKQNEEEATYLLKRGPEDGKIDWNESIEDIHRLIRAVSKPYPGAFGMYDGKHQIKIWRADILENKKYIGINGQIAWEKDGCLDIVCKNGLLHVTEYENIDGVKIIVGHKL